MTSQEKTISVVLTTNELLDSAIEYYELGWNVIPVREKVFFTGSKERKWKKYQEARPSLADIKRWFPNPEITGIALIHGATSRGLACRNFNSDDSYLNWTLSNPSLASVLPTVKTEKGYHVYFHWNKSAFMKFEDGELRANNLHYSLLPPSKQPEGHTYQWINDVPLDLIPTIRNPSSEFLIGVPAKEVCKTSVCQYPTPCDYEIHNPPEDHDIQIEKLRSLVVPYRHNRVAPMIEPSPDGLLHGIGFIYDSDRDDRVLVAIDQLKNNKNIIAVAEHKGILNVYSLKKLDITEIDCCCDNWPIHQFIPKDGEWFPLRPRYGW